MDTPADLFVGERSEPALHQVQPGGAGRGEVEADLAFLPPPEIERILRVRRPKRFTPSSPTTAAAIAKALREAREHGGALSVQEVTLGACGISAPIVGRDGWAIGSLGISGPMHRLTSERRAAMLGPVRDAARTLSALIRREGIVAGR
jgi:IclR family acetate operon transcriptional repressor